MAQRYYVHTEPEEAAVLCGFQGRLHKRTSWLQNDMELVSYPVSQQIQKQTRSWPQIFFRVVCADGCEYFGIGMQLQLL